MRTAWAIAVTALLLVIAPARASAAPRVAVIGDAEVAAAVAGALGPRVELVEVSGDEAAVLADEHQLAAVVTVEVTGSKRKAIATITVLDGASGKRLDSYAVKGKRAKLGKLAAAKAWRRLGKAIGKARAPSPPAAEPVTVAKAQPAPAPAPVEAPPEAPAVVPVRGDGIAASAMPARSRQAARWLVLTADGRPFLRTLRYHDDLEGRMRPYELAAPAAGITATWVPRPRGFARFFALRGELELAVGVNGSRTSSQMELPTSASEWSTGLRADLPVAGWRVLIDAAYSEHRFSIDDDAMAELVPDATYRMVRGVLSVRVPVRPSLSIDVGGGWRQLLSVGDLDSEAWFPRSDGAGIEAELGATWRATGAIELFARADLRRYFFSMHPEVGDTLVVGGAVDQYLAVVAGLSLSLR